MVTNSTSKTFRANAKLMISGEYLVLRGAESLAIPLRFGQSLTVSEHDGIPSIDWKTYVKGQYWFDAVFSLDEFVIANTNDFPTAQNLRDLIRAAKEMNPEFLKLNKKYQASSALDFDINWGIGSSSSLIVNIANWAGVDPFSLFSRISGGSAYDIAASMSDRPIVFRLNGETREIRETGFFPVFHENLYFVYLGKKRNSALAVKDFNELPIKDMSREISDITTITNDMILTNELREFRQLMRSHEKIISRVIGIPPVRENLFQDFNGDTKSLGAWGGDFVLLASDMPREYVSTWLRKKDMNIWFTFKDAVLKKSPDD